ncbi:hypothetical protein TanjilG_08008 [Lupinus angustifolius]|uniref:Uncharacterized protein n=1 Tax=Lupinus angustifolius TaxID=3871 RepID=A0A4P1RM23_LUPAN|nr:hypothetical protein TanjilG_08008 [Lupinus angustifolius]
MEFEKAYMRNIISPFEYDVFYYNKFILHFKILASKLKDTVSSINKFTILPSHFHEKTTMKEGIGSFFMMSAAYEFDLESSYNSFMTSLPNDAT